MLAAAGVWISVTVTPACGLFTVKVKSEMLVVPGDSLAAIECDVFRVAVPLQTRSKLARVHAVGAPA